MNDMKIENILLEKNVVKDTPGITTPIPENFNMNNLASFLEDKMKKHGAIDLMILGGLSWCEKLKDVVTWTVKIGDKLGPIEIEYCFGHIKIRRMEYNVLLDKKFDVGENTLYLIMTDYYGKKVGVRYD
jgi:hypothetical protein